MALALVIQFEYRVLDIHLVWAALLGWYVCFGAGPISLDRAVSRGLADSALPLVADVVKGGSLVRSTGHLCSRSRSGSGFAQRWWVASTTPWLRGADLRLLPPTLAVVAAGLLAFGLGTRIVAVVLAVLLVGHMGQAGERRQGSRQPWSRACSRCAEAGA